MPRPRRDRDFGMTRLPGTVSEGLNGWSDALTVGLAVWTDKTTKTKAGGAENFDYLILKLRILIWVILTYFSYFKVLLCNVKQIMRTLHDCKTKDERQHLYQSTLQFQQFQVVQLKNAVDLSGFLRKCAEHVVWRRTVLAVALHQEKRLSNSCHGRTDRRQCSLQLQKTRGLARRRRFVQRS